MEIIFHSEALCLKIILIGPCCFSELSDWWKSVHRENNKGSHNKTPLQNPRPRSPNGTTSWFWKTLAIISIYELYIKILPPVNPTPCRLQSLCRLTNSCLGAGLIKCWVLMTQTSRLFDTCLTGVSWTSAFQLNSEKSCKILLLMVNYFYTDEEGWN